ncbi:tRNA (cytosine(38)-C(5))-methyltransferase [Zancudomyces culisetae]|uniref:tRNA (cytosine(38)-C(5))-methyltransferase n=1 Tax=Zancudomyces culisetae TaxID=1213189 RepID=A0A1R1PTI6_ZANCU|nr:tRNA (cytosine(38)-C(5))-methyltransferase [Zancudomyces culisetae]|eukprot:OMH84239.1 tRNA (cytosine(38)-C(5))-methyltransferase [Zancudomyces culisetae]
MSPPCQPFTRGGKYLDDKDERTKPLLKILEILEDLERNKGKGPKYLFLENVKNFENSNTRKRIVTLLRELNYETKEYLLSPNQIGVPNNRLRYYLTAVKQCTSRKTGKNDPNNDSALNDTMFTEFPTEYLKQGPNGIESTKPKTLKEYLNPEFDPQATMDENTIEQYLVPLEKIMKRKHNNRFDFDIVDMDSNNTTTFTKAYGSKHLIGSGSLLLMSQQPGTLSTHLSSTSQNKAATADPSSEIANSNKTHSMPDHVNRNSCFPDGYDLQSVREILSRGDADQIEDMFVTKKAQLRFFTPNEVAQLMNFPLKSDSFLQTALKFPPQDGNSGISNRQQWQLLGNSVNVKVVSVLLKNMIEQ